MARLEHEPGHESQAPSCVWLFLEVPPSLREGGSAAADPGTGSWAPPPAELPLGLTFHGQLHCHLAGTTAVAGFTGILPAVLLTHRVNHQAESPPHSTVQQEAAPGGDGLPISVPCHLGLWIAPDLQEKETVKASVSRAQGSEFTVPVHYTPGCKDSTK